MKALKEKQILGAKLYCVKGGHVRPTSPTGQHNPPDGPPIPLFPKGTSSTSTSTNNGR